MNKGRNVRGELLRLNSDFQEASFQDFERWEAEEILR